jgi:hypothetical protein
LIEIDSLNECAPIAHMVEFRDSPAIWMIRELSAA